MTLKTSGSPGALACWGGGVGWWGGGDDVPGMCTHVRCYALGMMTFLACAHM